MPIQQYGALGATFLLARVFQGCCLIPIVGMTANFISKIVSKSVSPPGVLIGTIGVTSVAAVYCLMTSLLFFDNILPFLAIAVMDGLCLIALVVIAIIIGKPLSSLRCKGIGSDSAKSDEFAFSKRADNVLDQLSGTVVRYVNWVGASKSICLEAKAVWGLTIALCILVLFSCICCVCLWRQKKATRREKLEG